MSTQTTSNAAPARAAGLPGAPAHRTRPQHDTPATTRACAPGSPLRLRRALAERELDAARAEVASLSVGASPSRLERALERLAAARGALESLRCPEDGDRERGREKSEESPAALAA